MSIVPAPSTRDEGGIAIAADVEVDAAAWANEFEDGCDGGGVGENETGRNDSATHSYHTFPDPVSLQIPTRNSELLGKYRGSYQCICAYIIK